MKIPNSVCWNITTRCNDNCLFCYRNKNSKELDFDKQKLIIEKVVNSGICKISFTGGESLMVERIQDLSLYAKQKGLIVSLKEEW